MNTKASKFQKIKQDLLLLLDTMMDLIKGMSSRFKFRLVFIVIAIMAFSFVMGGNSPKEGKWVEYKEGCKIWNGMSSEIEKISWTGGCKDGYVSGEGTIKMSWPSQKDSKGDLQKISLDCTGTLLKGKLHGKSDCKWGNGAQYSGTFVQDQIATGMITYLKGQTEKTQWVEEKNGCLVWNPAPVPNEEVVWEGRCLKGYADGDGTLTFRSKEIVQRYEGPMKKGRKEGEGTYTWVKHNKPCNKTSNIYYCYKEFVGNFKKDKFDIGMYTLLNGKKVEGKSVYDRAIADMNASTKSFGNTFMEIYRLNQQSEQIKEIQDQNLENMEKLRDVFGRPAGNY